MKKIGILIVFLAACIFGAGFAAPTRATADEEFNEAFGAAAGFALYNLQIVIGITADAYAKQVYTNEETLNIVNEQKILLETLDGYVPKLQQLSSISQGDQDSLVKISNCIGKLDDTADALAAYVNDPSGENADAFQAKREASYNTLSDLLGLDDAPAGQ